jgi:hypothetical protein
VEQRPVRRGGAAIDAWRRSRDRWKRSNDRCTEEDHRLVEEEKDPCMKEEQRSANEERPNSFILVREGMLLEAPGTIECAVVGLGAEWRPFCAPASG